MLIKRVEFLGVRFDPLGTDEIDRFAAAYEGPFQYLVTPNVDHVVRLANEPDLRRLYDAALYRLCDSRIIGRLAKLSGIHLPLVTGSDLTARLFDTVIVVGDRIAVVGGTSDTISKLRLRYPHVEILHHEAPMGLRSDISAQRAAAEFIAQSNARFSFLVVGFPQQEMIARHALDDQKAMGLGFCVGASLEFLTGEQTRAPRALQRIGMEWLHRLYSNPRRLWRRYLVDDVKVFPIYLRWIIRHRKRAAADVVGLLLLLLGLVAAGTVYSRRGASSSVFGHSSDTSQASQSLMKLPPPNLVKPLTPEVATQINSETPNVQRPDTPAAKFLISSKTPEWPSARDCLAQAVYYEASSESVDGQRAVAQVVLNRVHHIGFPNSVCGVVYQGADKPPSCQFTFTCNGSLNRKPGGFAWSLALKIASEALSGVVYGPVGHATHYHADYVVPYWAESLDKSLTIGHHIFYRLPGPLGSKNAFIQRYSGVEPTPPIPVSNTVEAEASDSSDLVNIIAPAAPPTKSPLVADETKVQIAADQSAGTLLLDKDARIVTPKAKPDEKCSAESGKQLKATGPQDLRVGANSNC